MRGTAKYQRLKNVGIEVYKEKGDCGVIAVAIMAGVSYGKAYASLQRYGRQNRCGTTVPMLIGALNELTGNAHMWFVVPDAHRYTVNKAPEIHKKDALLLTSGHVCGMIGGVVHDWTQGRRHKVLATIGPINNNEEIRV